MIRLGDEDLAAIEERNPAGSDARLLARALRDERRHTEVYRGLAADHARAHLEPRPRPPTRVPPIDLGPTLQRRIADGREPQAPSAPSPATSSAVAARVEDIELDLGITLITEGQRAAGFVVVEAQVLDRLVSPDGGLLALVRSVIDRPGEDGVLRRTGRVFMLSRSHGRRSLVLVHGRQLARTIAALSRADRSIDAAIARSRAGGRE